ncbi:SWIM zinc finger family protein [Halorientalis brevis]|uniref:SWIM zinc finger family protein n=1 Tax=Halorientalis brevis TaxID=1126241 RepID=A0ABD6CFS0_9EURY|nr:SWIM zinc finger family protein [Halorientalis brevis]
MSSQVQEYVESPDLPEQIGGTPAFSRPEGWTCSTPWKRAQQEIDTGGPINDAERMVRLSDGEGVHRCTWALKGRTLLAECDCRGYQFHGGWCAHVASLWWQWINGEIVVNHLDTGREYPTPPAWLELDAPAQKHVFEDLTPAETDAYLSVELTDAGVREWARHTDRSPGTVGNQLRSAKDTLYGGVER